MDIHRMSDFGRILMANFWTSRGYSYLDVNWEVRYYCAGIMFHASFVANTKYVYIWTLKKCPSHLKNFLSLLAMCCFRWLNNFFTKKYLFINIDFNIVKTVFLTLNKITMFFKKDWESFSKIFSGNFQAVTHPSCNHKKI